MNRQVPKSRKALQDALLTLLEHKAFNKIRINELCEEANLSRATYYDHFDSKEELLVSVMDDLFSEISDDYSGDLAGQLFLEKSVEFRALVFSKWKDNRKTFNLLRKAKCDSLLQNSFYKWFLKQHTDGILNYAGHDNPVMTEYTIKIVSSSHFAVLCHWDDRGMKESPELLEKYLNDFSNVEEWLKIKDKYSDMFDQDSK